MELKVRRSYKLIWSDLIVQITLLGLACVGPSSGLETELASHWLNLLFVGHLPLFVYCVYVYGVY
jgi:hypothetical protein